MEITILIMAVVIIVLITIITKQKSTIGTLETKISRDTTVGPTKRTERLIARWVVDPKLDGSEQEEFYKTQVATRIGQDVLEHAKIRDDVIFNGMRIRGVTVEVVRND